MHVRDWNRRHEVQKNTHARQGASGMPNSSTPLENELRLDIALRLWGHGADKDYARLSEQDYNKAVYGPPEKWFDIMAKTGKDCFGLTHK